MLPELAFLISPIGLFARQRLKKKLEKLSMPYFVAATVCGGGACVDVFIMRNVEASSIRENIENPT